jgi:hypothetical protein
MWIVAISALYGLLIHFMMNGHGELLLDISVTLKAESRLRYLQQSFFFTAVDSVALDAAYVPCGVSRSIEVRMLSAMTTETPGIRLFDRSLGGIKDPRRIDALDMRIAGPVAAIAGDLATVIHLDPIAVRTIDEPFDHLCVAGHTRARGCLLSCGLHRRPKRWNAQKGRPKNQNR